jgi:hypothetical protein
MNTPAEKLLYQLDGVKSIGAGKWQARCPAHDDKTPSLSIKEINDGTLLLKCWAGCNAGEIVGAVGLELSDLFPKREGFDHRCAPKGQTRPWHASDVLRALMDEITIVAVCAGRLRNAGLTPEDAARLSLATQRLWAAGSAVNL